MRPGILLLAFIVNVGADCSYDALKTYSQWMLGSGWEKKVSLTNSTDTILSAENAGESFAWLKSRILDGSWIVTVDLEFEQLLRNGGETGTASLALTFDHSAPSVRMLVDMSRHRDGYVRLGSDYLEAGQWRTIHSDLNWRPSASRVFRLTVERLGTNNHLKISLADAAGSIAVVNAGPVPVSFLDRVSGMGVRVVGAGVGVNAVALESPLSADYADQTFSGMATCAATDLLSHFWEGDFNTGKLRNTWNGYSGNLPDPRGGIWERGIFILMLDGLERTTGDPRLKSRIASDWRYIKQAFSAAELQSCGANTVNPACDDAGWAALTYLAAYRSTGDSDALLNASNLVTNAFGRWHDSNFGGGMWYRDARDIKSVYQAGLVLAALKVSEISGEADFANAALQCTDWIEEKLLRADGLYWCDYNSAGPVGEERPYDINEAGSVTFLAGNMAMGVIHAWRYRHSGEEIHRTRAVRTANAIYRYLTRSGVFLNDRDAWTNATFVCDWASDVLTLEGISGRDWQVIRATAASIYAKARTFSGYFGGSWSGPAEGTGSKWWQTGSRPEQIMTSATSATMIVAAALLEQVDASAHRPSLTGETIPLPGLILLHGTPGWSYTIETSADLAVWNFERVIQLTGRTAPVITAPYPEGAPRFYRSKVHFEP